jgi:ATP-dependent RNA helicase DHX37/DHR1
VIEYVIDDAS